MTDLQVIAKAILDLAEKAATTWDYDGNTMHSTGVQLDFRIVEELERIAEGKTDE